MICRGPKRRPALRSLSENSPSACRAELRRVLYNKRTLNFCRGDVAGATSCTGDARERETVWRERGLPEEEERTYTQNILHTGNHRLPIAYAQIFKKKKLVSYFLPFKKWQDNRTHSEDILCIRLCTRWFDTYSIIIKKVSDAQLTMEVRCQPGDIWSRFWDWSSGHQICPCGRALADLTGHCHLHTDHSGMAKKRTTKPLVFPQWPPSPLVSF